MPTQYLPFMRRFQYDQDKMEDDFYLAFLSHKDQGRKEIILSPVLSLIAREYACDLALNNYFSHIGQDGRHANERVRARYVLPSNYRIHANNVESLSAGYKTSADSLNGLYKSPAHYRHLSGKGVFAKQIHIGIGFCYYKNSKYQRYWVFLSAP